MRLRFSAPKWQDLRLGLSGPHIIGWPSLSAPSYVALAAPSWRQQLDQARISAAAAQRALRSAFASAVPQPAGGLALLHR
jgi:hypothetical protein